MEEPRSRSAGAHNEAGVRNEAGARNEARAPGRAHETGPVITGPVPRKFSGAHGTLVALHQVDATLVALIPTEGGLEEGVDESDGLVVAVLAGTDSHHVRIVVLAGQARGRVRPDEGGAHARHAVGGHLLAVTGTADDSEPGSLGSLATALAASMQKGG